MDVSPAALRSFLVLASDLHYGRAAKTLGLSVPGLSLQIARLERVLGQQLVLRTSRHAELTPAGTAFISVAREAHDAYALIDAWSKQGEQHLSRHLRVGVGAGGVGRYNTPILSAAIEQIPGLRLEIQRVDLMHAAEGLRDRSLDVLLSPGLSEVQHPDVDVVVALPDPRVLVVAKDHPLAGRTSVTLAETSHETYIWIGDDSAEANLQSWLIDPRPDGTRLTWGPRAHEFEGVLELCAAGLGVNIAGASAALRYQWPGLAFVPISDVKPAELLVSVLRSAQTPLLAEFLAVVDKVSHQESDR